jgi:2'-hydroxyisoflavone reductase
MRVLILGGTSFVGRALTEAALSRGHEVTLFNRGRTNPDLFPGATRVHGDRDGGLDVLERGRWEAALDVCGYVPRVVRQSTRFLGDRVSWYGFVSTISVYANLDTLGLDEGAATAVLEKETEEVNGETYGPLKALCEREVEEAFPGRSLVVRPGIIVGPHDPTDRFTYWVERTGHGGEVLAPAPPEQPVQVIDASDLAGWTLDLMERGMTGTLNAVGPAEPLTMDEILATCREVSGSDARVTWVDGTFLAEAGVGTWMELPLWLGPGRSGVFAVSNRRALAAGLRFRPLVETVRDTLAWARTLPPDRDRRAGLAAGKEETLLERWKAH